MSLIAESEMPERYRIAGSELDVVFDDESIRNTLDLFFPFLTPADLECIVIDHKIGNGRGDYVVVHPHLIEEEGFPDIADFGFIPSEIIDKVCIVQINLVHLTQPPNPTGIVPKLSDKSCLLDVETIIGYTVPAYVKRRGDATDIWMDGYAFG